MLCPITRTGQASDRSGERPIPVILAFGLKPERFVGSEARIDAVLEPPSAEEADVLVQALTSGIEAGGTVIAVLPQWFPPEGALRLDMARSMLDTDRVAVHETALPPLAGAVLCSLASPRAARPERRRARLAAARARGRAARLHLAGLRVRPERARAKLRPAPRVAGPQQRVRRLELAGAVGPQAVLRRAGRAAAGDHAAVADGHRAAQRRRELGQGVVNPALGGLPVAEVEATPGGPAWWGTSKVVESVVFPVDVEELAADLMADVDPWGCRWCRELIARSPCPLCGHRGRPRRRAQPHQQGGVRR